MSVPSLAAGIIISLLAFAGPAVMVAAATPAADSAPGAAVSTRYVTVQGIKVFYREAGSRNAPSIVLLHGFPTSSHEWSRSQWISSIRNLAARSDRRFTLQLFIP